MHITAFLIFFHFGVEKFQLQSGQSSPTKMFYKLSTTFAAAGLESNKITRKSFNDIFNSCSLYYQVKPESTFFHIFYNDINKRILVVILFDKMLFNFDETF